MNQTDNPVAEPTKPRKPRRWEQWTIVQMYPVLPPLAVCLGALAVLDLIGHLLIGGSHK